MENTGVQKRFNVENGNETELDKNSTPDKILETLGEKDADKFLSALPGKVFSDQIYRVLDIKEYFGLILKYSDKLGLNNDEDIVDIINKVPERCELEDEDSLYVREYLKEHKNNFRGKFGNEVRIYCLRSISKKGFDWGIFTCFNGVSLIDSIIEISNKENGNKYIRKTWGTMRNLYNSTPLFTVGDTKKIIGQGLGDIIIKTPEFFDCDEEIIKLLIKTPIKKEDKQKRNNEINNEINKQEFISCSDIKNLDKGHDGKNFDKKYRDAIIERLGNYDNYETRAGVFESFVDNIDQEWLTYLVGNQNGQEFLIGSRINGSHDEIKKLNFNEAIEKSLNSVGYNRQFSSINLVEAYRLDFTNKGFLNLYLEKFYSYLKEFTENLGNRSVSDFENYFSKNIKDFKEDVLELIRRFYPGLKESNDEKVTGLFKFIKRYFNKSSEDGTKTGEDDQELFGIINDIIEKYLSVFKKYLDKCRGSYKENYDKNERFYLELDELILELDELINSSNLNLHDSESLLEIWNRFLKIKDFVENRSGIDN